MDIKEKDVNVTNPKGERWIVFILKLMLGFFKFVAIALAVVAITMMLGGPILVAKRRFIFKNEESA